MKWDIDKSLTQLENSSIPATSVARTMLGDVASIEREGLTPTSEERAKQCAIVWCLALGRINEPKLFVYERDIRAVYLKARRIIKGLSPEQLTYYGIQSSKKRKNSYAAARKKSRK
jgi:hypothetical protein